jgi:nucleotidyltransferase/DNA polymerase involved in DNA repair
MDREREKPPLGAGGRTILHVDLDAFFASVEVREDPSLRGKPVIVGADPRGGRGRGVVAAASYEARQFGVHSAMPISQAYRRCPRGVYVRPRMRLYVEVSDRFMAILRRYTELAEPLSIDEAFLDVTASRRLFGDGEVIARRIKEDVANEERVTASIGVAPAKFLAKIASDLDKPDGLVVVRLEEVRDFLDRLPVKRLWGAGPKAIERFRRLGVETIGDVARLSREKLLSAFGESLGDHFHRLASGIDAREVVSDHQRRSVGRETTFPEDVHDRRLVERTLLDLLDDVTQRLRKSGIAGQTVTVKLRTSDFSTVTRQDTVAIPADTADVLWPTVRDLFAKADCTEQAIRLVGVALSGFDEVRQLSLFENPTSKRSRRIASALDAVTHRFGEDAISRGALLGKQKPRRTGPGGG